MKFKSQFVKDAFALTSRMGLAQIIGILSHLMIMRIYTTEEYSYFAIFSSWILAVEIGLCGNFNRAIVTAQTSKEADSLVWISIIVGMVMTLIVSATAFGVVLPTNPWIIYLPWSLLSLVFMIVAYWYQLRFKNLKLLGVAKIAQTTTNVSLQIGLGLLKTGPIGLIIGSVLGPLMAFLILIFRFKQKPSFSKTALLPTARKYKSFVLYSWPAHIVINTARMLPGLLFPLLGWASSTGFVFLSFKILYLPIVLISQSVAQVFFKKVADETSMNLPQTIRKLLIRLILIAALPSFVLSLEAPRLFVVIFGSQWMAAGVYTKYLLVWFFFQFLEQAVNPMYDVWQKQRRYFILSLGTMIVQVSSLFTASHLSLGPHMAVLLYSLTGALGSGFVITDIYLLSRRK